MIDTIIEMLHQLTDLYQQLYETSLRKKQGIVENKVEEVNEAVKKEWSLLSDASLLEEKRLNAVAEVLGRDRRAGEDPGTLVDLEAVCGNEKQKEELQKAGNRLLGVLEKQRTLNAEIQGLVDLNLELTNYMVNMVFREPEVSNIYGTSGYVVDDDREAGGLHGIIDSQV